MSDPTTTSPLREALLAHFSGLVDGLLAQEEAVEMLDAILDGQATLIAGGNSFTVAPYAYNDLRTLIAEKYQADDTPPPSYGLYL